ncbi:MAG: hypothetical protein QM778_28620 [Myxococcales bacterium]
MAAWAYAGWALGGALVGWGVLSTTRRLGAGTDSNEARETKIWAAMLVSAPLFYLAFALLGGASSAWLRIELLGLLLYGGLAAAGVARWPALVGIGWLLHMVWDSMVHMGTSATHVPSWYMPGCLGFDLVVGIMLLLGVRQRPPAVVRA